MLESAQLARVSQGAPTTVLASDASLDVRVMVLRYRLDGEAERRQINERRVLQGLTLVYLAEQRGEPEEFGRLLAAVDGFLARGAPPSEIDALEELVWL